MLENLAKLGGRENKIFINSHNLVNVKENYFLKIKI